MTEPQPQPQPEPQPQDEHDDVITPADVVDPGQFPPADEG